MRVLAPGLVLALCAAAMPAPRSRAENNCGRMVESIVRLGGVAGVTHDFELRVMHCDGVFRRFLDLRPGVSPQPVQEFAGTLEVGRRYRAVVHWDPALATVLEPRLRLPMHHGGGVHWLDSEAAPKLGPARRSATATFDVVSRETQQRGEREWATFYTCAWLPAR